MPSPTPFFMETVTCSHCQTDNKITSKYCSACGYELPKPEPADNLLQEPVKTTGSRRKSVGIIGGILAAGLTYWGVNHFFFKSPSFDEVMMEVASELNKTCPVMVDQHTRLDNAIALPENSFQYNYTLVNLRKDEVNLDAVKENVEPGILNNIRTNPDMKIYRDNKTTLIYYYKDMNGEFVHKYSVTPAMYE